MNLIELFFVLFSSWVWLPTFWTSSPLPCWTLGTTLSETIWVYLFQNTIWPLWPASLRRWTKMDSRVSRQDMCLEAFSSGVWLLAGWYDASRSRWRIGFPICLQGSSDEEFAAALYHFNHSLVTSDLQSPNLQVCACGDHLGLELSPAALSGTRFLFPKSFSKRKEKEKNYKNNSWWLSGKSRQSRWEGNL